MDHMHNQLYWAGEAEWEEAREGGSLGVAGEEETMEYIVERSWFRCKSGQGEEIKEFKNKIK